MQSPIVLYWSNVLELSKCFYFSFWQMPHFVLMRLIAPMHRQQEAESSGNLDPSSVGDLSVLDLQFVIKFTEVSALQLVPYWKRNNDKASTSLLQPSISDNAYLLHSFLKASHDAG